MADLGTVPSTDKEHTTMETAYLDLLKEVLLTGTKKEDRTGTGTLSVFGRQIRCDLQEGFPLITTKKVFWKGVVAELLWFLKGSTNIKELQEQGVHIWDEWADEDGELGPVYGRQWRFWFGRLAQEFDQIAKVIETLKTNPDSRRMLVSAWNVGELDEMALAPCHAFFQFYTTPIHHDERFQRFTFDNAGVPKYRLSCHMYQRSADLFLGVPFNIASYALLTHMVAQVVHMDVGELIISYGDAHIYLNHLSQVEEQLSRAPKPLPTLKLTSTVRDIDGFRLDDCQVVGYDPHPAIKAPVAI